MVWVKGQSGNYNGRPKRKTFRDYFNEEEEAELINKIKQSLKKDDKSADIIKLTVEHLFGKPRQNIGLDGGEEDKPVAILNYVSRNNGNSESNGDVKKNKGDSGGDISEQDNIDSLIPDSPSAD